MESMEILQQKHALCAMANVRFAQAQISHSAVPATQDSFLKEIVVLIHALLKKSIRTILHTLAHYAILPADSVQLKPKMIARDAKPIFSSKELHAKLPNCVHQEPMETFRQIHVMTAPLHVLGATV